MRSIRNCNVCVVGGAGFLGSHLVDHLIDDRQCKVTVVDNLVSGSKSFVHKDAKFVHMDITGPEEDVRNLLIKDKISYVFNYAASPYIPVSFERPLYVFNINAFAALKVINAAHDAGCEGILQVSSAEIYGDQTGKISESAPVTPHSAYGASKAAIDFMVQARWRENRTKCIALRQFNTLGERESHKYVIPEIISQLTHVYSPPDRPLMLGNNSQRDFMYAGDAVKAATELLEKGEFGQVYNLGSQESIHIYTLAKKIGSMMGCGNVVIKEDLERIRPWEIWSLTADSSKIYSTIDYRPQVSFDEALQRTIDYYNANGRKWIWER